MNLFDSTNITNIPEGLKSLRQWVNWSYKKVGKKQTKIPINPLTLGNAKTDTDTTWTVFDTALRRAEEKPRRYGIGLVLVPPLVGIDLDHCVVGNVATPYAQEVLKTFRGHYAEWSPSGEGIHILCEGEIARAVKTAQHEIYTEKRFFTVTGAKLPGHPREAGPVSHEGQEWLSEMTVPPVSFQEGYDADFDPDDDSEPGELLLDTLRAFEPRFDGVWKRTAKLKGKGGDSSDSAYEMVIARYAVNAGCEDQDVYRLLVTWRRKHGLAPKNLKGIQSTIATAHEGWDETERDKILDNPETQSAEEKKEHVTTVLGLDIVRIVQMGRGQSVFRVHLKGQDEGIHLGNYAQFTSVKTWESLIYDYTHVTSVFTAKRWNKIKALLGSLAEYEDSPGTSDNDETASWVHDYAGGNIQQGADYDTVRDQLTFLEDGYRYLTLGKLLFHVRVNHNPGVNRVTLAGRLRALGWVQAEIKRTHPNETQVDSKGKTLVAHTRYWKHTV